MLDQRPLDNPAGPPGIATRLLYVSLLSIIPAPRRT